MTEGQEGLAKYLRSLNTDTKVTTRIRFDFFFPTDKKKVLLINGMKLAELKPRECRIFVHAIIARDDEFATTLLSGNLVVPDWNITVPRSIKKYRLDPFFEAVRSGNFSVYAPPPKK